LHPTIGLSNYGWRLPCPARFSNGTMVFLCVRNRVNICHMQMHETFAIWYCTLRNANVYYATRLWYKASTASTQSRMKWRCTTRNMLTNTMGQPTTSMRKVKHDHAIYCDSNKGLIMSRLNHLCSMSTKGCILQCHTKGIPIDMSSTNQRQHNPIFLSRTYTPKRFWSHGWYGLAGSSSLRKGGQELSIYDFEGS
jgi:hypothetical protein